MARLYLVVDDDPVTAEQSRRLIEGFEREARVLIARSVEEAIALVGEQGSAPAMVFLECNLPGTPGTDFLLEARSRGWLARTPVAMLTRPVEDRLVVTCYRLGACAFLKKPVRPHELRETIRDFARPGALAGGARRFAAA